MLRYTEIGFYEKVLGTLGNTRKNEVILRYAKKNKSAHGLPRQYVANYLGVKRTAIVEIESGKRCVKAEELRQFSRLFRISADSLLEGDEISLSDDELLRGFTELDDADRQEILNLIEFKKMLKNKKG